MDRDKWREMVLDSLENKLAKRRDALACVLTWLDCGCRNEWKCESFDEGRYKWDREKHEDHVRRTCEEAIK